jgi:hypothetical protein
MGALRIALHKFARDLIRAKSNFATVPTCQFLFYVQELLKRNAANTFLQVFMLKLKQGSSVYMAHCQWCKGTCLLLLDMYQILAFKVLLSHLRWLHQILNFLVSHLCLSFYYNKR